MGGPNDPRLQDLKDNSREALRSHRRKLRAGRKAVFEALVNEPYDETRLKEALAKIHDQSNEAQELAQEKVLALASRLTAEERAALKVSLSRKDGPQGPGRKRRGKPSPNEAP